MMSAYDEMLAVCSKSNSQVFTAGEIFSLLEKRYPNKHRKRDSAQPSRYCYNRIRKGIPFDKHIFIYEEYNQYRFVGENYNYTGPVYFKKSETQEKDKIKVGEWKNGKCTLSGEFANLLDQTSPQATKKSELPTIAHTEDQNEVIEDILTLNDSTLTQTEKEILIQARIGQGLFRSNLINYWKRCPITGCSNPALLRASHIKPWRKSEHHERIDYFNGLLLTPNYDLAFDRFLVTFEEDGKIAISSILTESDISALNIKPSARIQLTDQHNEYLKFHRDVFLRKQG
jgi:hypothetical protein